jgi:hypothetical protein
MTRCVCVFVLDGGHGLGCRRACRSGASDAHIWDVPIALAFPIHMSTTRVNVRELTEGRDNDVLVLSMRFR